MTTSITTVDLLDPRASAALRRSSVPDADVQAAALDICTAVQRGGDAALADAGRRFGGSRPQSRVSADECATAWESASADLRNALENAAGNIRTYQEAMLPERRSVTPVPGVQIDRIWTPLRSIGAYVPGGKAAYPSTLLMTVVPARVAGVGRIVVTSPCGPDGELDPALLAAAHLAGVDELYALGGAQAIAALAYGTETIEPVDKIVGPGNAWVTAAKLAVAGTCAIDMPAGPSEVLVIADETADPRLVAVDLLCQAEHGPDSPAILVSTDRDLSARVLSELDDLLPSLERRAILAKALTSHGLVVNAPDMDAAVDYANRYAAEHVTVLTSNPEAVAGRITSAGSVYVGRWSPESAGDYATGANHVLPTGGLASAMSPLGVEDFGSWRQTQTLTEEGLAAISQTICTLATAEGLTAHRLAAEIRLERRK
jgi:histidinol dehydrogenase